MELRDNHPQDECPTNSFTTGEPNGTCEGDGHYQCKMCKHYREDFKRLGQDYIDFYNREQMSKIHIITL